MNESVNTDHFRIFVKEQFKKAIEPRLSQRSGNAVKSVTGIGLQSYNIFFPQAGATLQTLVPIKITNFALNAH